MKNRQCYNIKYCIYKSVILTIILTISSIQLKGQNVDEDETNVTEYSDTLICKDNRKYPYNYLLIECKDKVVQKKVNLYYLFLEDFYDIEDEYIPYLDSLYSRYKLVKTSRVIKQIKDTMQKSEVCERTFLNNFIMFKSYKLLSTQHRYYWCCNYKGEVHYHNFDLRTGKKLDISDIISEEGLLEISDLIQRKIIKIIQNNYLDRYTKYILLCYNINGVDMYSLDSFVFVMTSNGIPGIQFKFMNFWNTPNGKARDLDVDLSFSFKELEPCFTKDFKNRVWIPIKNNINKRTSTKE